MKPFTISKSSWHYSLVKMTKDWSSGQTEINICQYIGAVFRGMLLWFVAFALILAFAIPFCYTLYSVFMRIFYGVPMPDFVVACISIVIGVAIVTSAAIVAVLSKEYMYEKEPGLFRLAYSKFKNKTCFKLKIED